MLGLDLGHDVAVSEDRVGGGRRQRAVLLVRLLSGKQNVELVVDVGARPQRDADVDRRDRPRDDKRSHYVQLHRSSPAARRVSASVGDSTRRPGTAGLSIHALYDGARRPAAVHCSQTPKSKNNAFSAFSTTSFHSIHKLVDRGVLLQAMWEELADSVGEDLNQMIYKSRVKSFPVTYDFD